MIDSETPPVLDGKFTWNGEPVRTGAGPWYLSWHATVGRSYTVGAGHSEAQAITNLIEQLYRETQAAAMNRLYAGERADAPAC